MSSLRRYGIFILIVLLYCVYVFTNSGRTHIVDEVSLFAVTESLGLRGEVDTNAIAWTQWVNSPGEVLGAFGSDGEVYSKKGPGPAFLAVPWYLLLRMVVMFNIHIGLLQGALLWNGFVTALTAGLLWLTAARLGYGDRTGMWLGLLFGLCTIAWPYANQFFGEPISTLSLLTCFYGILAWKQTGKAGWMWLSGIGAGVTIATVTAHVLLVLILALYFAVSWWKSDDQDIALNAMGDTSHRAAGQRLPLVMPLIGFFAPIALTGGLLLLYNFVRFGSPLDSGYHFDSGEGFTTPLWQGLWGFLFSPYRGVFLHTPLFILSVIGFVPFFRRHRREGIAIGALTAVLVLLYSMWWMWWGGYAWGPRFLVPLTPFWVLLIAPLLVRLGIGDESDAASPPSVAAVWRWLFWGVVTASFLVQLLAVSINFVNFETLLRSEFFATNWENPLEFGPPAQSIGDLLLSPVFGQIRLVWRGGLAANSDLAWLWAGGRVLWLPLIVGVAAIGTAAWALIMWLKGARTNSPETAIPSPPMTILLAVIPVITMGAWLGAAVDDPIYGDMSSGYHAAIVEMCGQQGSGDVLVTVAPFGYHIPMNWLAAHCRPAPPIYGYATSSMERPQAQQVMTRLMSETDRIHLITSGLAPSDPENTVERWLAQHAFKADDRWFDNERLLEYATPARLSLEQFVQHHLFVSDQNGNSVTIVQSRAPAQGEPGAITPVEITYMPHTPPIADLRWFVQLLAPDGRAVVQLDTGPDDNYTPFTALRANALYTERAGLLLPADLPPGDYQVIAGLYNPAMEGAPRLRAADGRDYLVLSTLSVGP
jgi:hypothetical protein